MVAAPSRVRDVFLAAADLPPGDRPAYLAAACGPDPALRAAVDRLLAAHARPDRLLDRPPVLFGYADTGADPDATLTRTADDTPAPARPVPPTLGGYRIERLLGEGGMGAVYLAHDDRLGRSVALKTMRPDAAAAPGAAARFAREARAAAQVAHDNVVPIWQVGEDAGVPFIAMPALDGEPLDRVLRRHPVCPVDLVLKVGREVAQGLAAAHARGLVHRDVKPANIWVEGDPTAADPLSRCRRVRVLDFGLARSAAAGPDGGGHGERRAAGADLTADGTVVGTPAYMSPEQARGDMFDARTDLFSLGVVLYRMATGVQPFRGATAYAVLSSLANDHPDPPAAANPAVPAALSALILRLLAKDPAGRPASAAAVAAAIADYQVYLESRLRESEQQRRRRTERALAAAVGLILLGGGAIGWWQWVQDQRRREQKLEMARLGAKIEAERFAQQLERERVASAERERRARAAQLIESLVGRCRAAIEAGDADRTAALLDQARQQATEGGTGDSRDILDRCQAELDLLTELDRIDRLRWAARGNKFQRAADTAAAFERIGVVPARTPPAEAARRVGDSPARWRLVGELDWWLATTGRADVRDVLAAADPDGFRGEVRDRVAAGDWEAVGRLISGPDAPDQPAWFAAVIGSLENVAVPARAALLTGALRREPGGFAALMAVGRLHQPDPAAAVIRARCCQGAVALRPRDAGAWRNLGTALRDGGDIAGAVAAFGKAVAMGEKSAAAIVDLGTALAAAGDWKGATDAYAAAIDADAAYAPAYHGMGAAILVRRVGTGPNQHFATAAAADAISLVLADRNYSRATELDPMFTLPLCGRGDIRMRQGDFAGAEKVYRRAADVDHTCAAAWCGLGHARRAKEDLEGAVDAYRHAVVVTPKDAAARFYLGRALHDRGFRRDGEDAERDKEWGEASEWFRESLRLDPRNGDAHTYLGMLLCWRQEYGGAIEHFEAAVRIERANPPYQTDRKKSHYQYNLDLAIEEHQKAGNRKAP